MAKCSNCGAELNAGVKFCEECGTPVPQTKTCPKCGAELKPEAKFCGECGYSFAAKSAPSAKAGVSVGDKNVIAGDVVGESYKITGGATIVKNEDETKKMVRCHVCGRNMPITEAITCIKCGEHTCESCMDLRVKSCKSCVESVAREQDGVYRQAVVRVLEDGVVTLAERRELKALQKQLGLTDARVEEIENQVRADQGRKQVEAPALSSFEKITLERAIETFYGVGDTAAAFAAVEPIYGRHPEDEQVVSFYAAVLAAKDPKAARSFVDGLHADILGVKLAGIDAALAENDLNDAEIRLDSVARIWPDSVLVKCCRIAFLLAMNEQLDEKSFLGQANALALDLSEGETKLEKSFVERTIRRVMKATGETVEDLSDEDCRARGLYPFLSRGDMTSLSPVVQTLIDNEAAADDWSDKESSSSNDTYSVVLRGVGRNKLAVIRELRGLRGADLFTARGWTDNIPAIIAENISRAEADRMVVTLESVGASASVEGASATDADCSIGKVLRGFDLNVFCSEMVAIPSRNYKLGRTPVTQEQWEAVMGSNPSSFIGADRPVNQVSWNDCQAFIRKLNNLTGKNFRLPTGDEWDYACLAGGSGRFGNVKGGYEGRLDEMGWYEDNSGDETHPVAQKQPNAWGLYDMHGNVWEWCSDIRENGRCLRKGGCYNNPGPMSRAGFGLWDENLDARGSRCGFRLALSM